MQYQLSRIIAGPFLHTLAAKDDRAENIPASGGAILAANHLSVVDSVYLPLMVPPPGDVLGQDRVLHASAAPRPGCGLYMRATNQLRIDRDGPRAAQDTLEAALARLAGRPAVRHLPRGHQIARTAASTGAGPAWPGWR